MKTYLPDNVPFNLFACCVPVKGSTRSVICDLQRKSFTLIPNGLFEILTKYEGKTLTEVKAIYNGKYDDVINDYFLVLVEKEYILDFTKIESRPRALVCASLAV